MQIFIAVSSETSPPAPEVASNKSFDLISHSAASFSFSFASIALLISALIFSVKLIFSFDVRMLGL
jgi:hypothetical protein